MVEFELTHIPSHKAEGPRIVEVAGDPTKMLKSRYLGADTEGRPQMRIFTEKEGLTNLITFLNMTIRVAQEKGVHEILVKAQAFKENLVYIGTTELGRAVRVLAGDLVKEVKSGKDVYVYCAGNRSERFISLLLVEEFHKLTTEDVSTRESLRISRSARDIARDCSNKAEGTYTIVVPDDFIVSGNRIIGFTGRMLSSLLEVDIAPNIATQSIQAFLVAAPRRDSYDTDPLKVSSRAKGNYFEGELNINAYYAVPEYKNPQGVWYVFPGVSVTGSHCTVDHGYEDVIKDFFTFLTEHDVQIDFPSLANIERPYELDDDFSTTPRFEDTELQKRWEDIIGNYGLSN